METIVEPVQTNARIDDDGTYRLAYKGERPEQWTAALFGQLRLTARALLYRCSAN